jgi:hypothetical protein
MFYPIGRENDVPVVSKKHKKIVSLHCYFFPSYHDALNSKAAVGKQMRRTMRKVIYAILRGVNYTNY